MHEFIDPVFAKTSPKRSFSVIENERFRLVFAKIGFINSATGVRNIIQGVLLGHFKDKAGSLKMNTALEYRTRVVQEGGRRCKKSTLNDLVHLTPLRIPLMNPPILS